MACTCDETLITSIEECVQKCTHTISTDCVILPSATCNYPAKTTLTEWLEDACASGTGGCTVNEVTYDELVELIETSGLSPCELYILTDYQTIYDQPDFEDDGAGGYQSKAVLETKTGPVLPLVLTAVDSNTINPNGFLLEYPHIQVYYIPIDEDTGLPPTTSVMGATTKGAIFRMIDTLFNVDCYYDYLSIQYKRYYNSAAPFGDDRDYMYVVDNGEDFLEFYSFNTDNFSYVDIKIPLSYELENNPTGLPNNVFFNEAFGLDFEAQCIQNTFINKVISLTVTAGFVYNLFLDEVNDAYFGHISVNNTFQGKLLATRFLSSSYGNIFQDDVEANIFYGDCGAINQNNLFFGIVKNNTFKGDVLTNNFLYSVEGNHFDSHVIENYFMCALTFNHFNSLVAGNTFRFEVQEVIVSPSVGYELSFSFNNITGVVTNNFLYGEPALTDEDVTPTQGIFVYNNIGVFADNGTDLNNCYIADFNFNNVKVFVDNQFGDINGALSYESVYFSYNNVDVMSNNIIKQMFFLFNTIGNLSSNNISGNLASAAFIDEESIIAFSEIQTFAENTLSETVIIYAKFGLFGNNTLTTSYIAFSDIYNFGNQTYTATSIVGASWRGSVGSTSFDVSFTGVLTAGSSILSGWIPEGAIPTKIIVVPDAVVGDALAEIEVGIEVEDESYGLPPTDITTLTTTLVSTLSNKLTANRQIKITASVADITGGSIQVFVEYVRAPSL